MNTRYSWSMNRSLVVAISLFATPCVALAASGPRAYVTNSLSDNVSVIDLTTNTVVGLPIPVGIGPVKVAITPDGNTAYVVNSRTGSDNVSAIDLTTNTVVGSPIPVGFNPLDIAITPDGTTAYVVNNSPDNVSVLDLTTNTVVGSPIPVGTNPSGIAITPDGNTAYVPNFLSDDVSVIDLTTNTVVGLPILVGIKPHDIAITPDGNTAYVVNIGSGNVSVINLTTNAVVGSIHVGSGPWRIAITPDGSTAYVAVSGRHEISMIDVATNAVVGTIPVINPSSIAFTPDGTTAYVVISQPYTIVSVIDVAARAVVGTIPVGNGPSGITIALFNPVLPIDIDIKPNSDPNSINLCSNGAVPIAILGSGTLDVLDINTDSLRFADASIKVVGRKDPHQLCSYEDVNGDFITDLVCHFLTTDIAGIDGESSFATLNGELGGGTAIEGSDSVNIVKDTCK